MSAIYDHLAVQIGIIVYFSSNIFHLLLAWRDDANALLVDETSHTHRNLRPFISNAFSRSFSDGGSLSQSPFLSHRLTTIPTYLLPSQLHPQLTQYRYSSTTRRVDLKSRPYRVHASQGTHRNIKSPSLTLEQAQCIRTAKSLGLELTTESTFPQPKLSHLNSSGAAHMISISSKTPTHRVATAVCTVLFSNASVYGALSNASLQKGDALAVARVAGIMAAKKTADLIPLAHPGLGITGVGVEVELFEPSDGSDSARSVEKAQATFGEENAPDISSTGLNATPPANDTTADAKSPLPQSRFGGVSITATVECEGKTGVEMEALTAASVAGLTVYDMCKGVDKGMVMQGVRVVKKTGGKSGGWIWDEESGAVKPMARDSTAAAKTGGTELHQHREGIQNLRSDDRWGASEAPSEAPLEQFFRLIAMNGKEFAAELHRMRRAGAIAWEAKKERERIRSERKRAEEDVEAARRAIEEQTEREKQQAAEEEEKVRAHVAGCEAEVRSGERGRVQQVGLEKARKERRRWFERSIEGTVLVPESREWVVGSSG
jgi:molybdenum cofactor biosynthesis protein MoaC